MEGNPLHPRHTPDLFGHTDVEDAFARGFHGNALHHAWLLTGPDGVGKATFAYRAARFLLCPDEQRPREGLAVDPASAVFRQIAAQAHPSLFVLESDGGSIAVEATRQLKGFLSLTSPAGWRAVIVDRAEAFTIAAANALLKGLEEPPPRTVFFLIAQGAGSLLPTIRSRCLRVEFKPLDEMETQAAVTAALARASVNAPHSEIAQACHHAEGSPGRALALLHGDAARIVRQVDALVASLPRLDRAALQALFAQTQGARNSTAYAFACDRIEEAAEARAIGLARGSENLAEAQQWAALWSWFRTERISVETLNLDKAAFLLTAFSSMDSIARGEPPALPSLER